jgi:hypothetical protein
MCQRLGRIGQDARQGKAVRPAARGHCRPGRWPGGRLSVPRRGCAGRAAGRCGRGCAGGRRWWRGGVGAELLQFGDQPGLRGVDAGEFGPQGSDLVVAACGLVGGAGGDLSGQQGGAVVAEQVVASRSNAPLTRAGTTGHFPAGREEGLFGHHGGSQSLSRRRGQVGTHGQHQPHTNPGHQPCDGRGARTGMQRHDGRRAAAATLSARRAGRPCQMRAGISSSARHQLRRRRAAEAAAGRRTRPVSGGQVCVSL